MSRYDALLELIDEHKPKSIVEIGVWNGFNAIRMIKRALRYNTDVTYTGYDLFEDATEETDKREFNVKGHNRMNAVAAYIKAEASVKPTLIKGDTNETLKPTVADFVFLDGGHSVATIKHDYEMVATSKVVVLDDYYTPDENGNCPDIKKYGCNSIFRDYETGMSKEEKEEFDKAYTVCTKKIEYLPTKDPVKGGGYTQLVVVR